MPPPAPPGGGTTSCGAKTIAFDWRSDGYQRIQVNVSEDSPVVLQFTVASAPSGRYPKVGVSNTGGSDKVTSALASSPCTFPTQASKDPVIGTASQTGQTATFPFTVPGTSANVYGPPLQLGGTYYVNIKSVNGSSTLYVDLYN